MKLLPIDPVVLKKENGEWGGVFEGKSAFGGADVDAAAEFSSVSGLQSLGLGVKYSRAGVMDLQASVAYTATECDSAATGDGVASKGSGMLELTVGGTAVRVEDVSIEYYKCAKPSAKWELVGLIPSMMLPGDVSFRDVAVRLQKSDGDWAGTLEGTSMVGGDGVRSTAEFSSVDGLKSLDIAGKTRRFDIISVFISFSIISCICFC